MRDARVLSVSDVLTTLVAVAAFTAAAPLAAQGAAKPSDDQIIASAMKAAPATITKAATIIAFNEDGTQRTVRKGTNGWTCLPDSPATPGPDPMCADANAMAWIGAWLNHLQPAQGKVGMIYMLEGGTDASNTDPYAAAPAPNNHWVKTGPHLMIVGAATMMAGYPRAAEPDTSAPYVMWADTPYEHLMVPVH